MYCLREKHRSCPGKKRNDNKFTRQPFFTSGPHMAAETSMAGIKNVIDEQVVGRHPAGSYRKQERIPS
jgi:hypothetical protein